MTPIVELNHKAIWKSNEALSFCQQRGITVGAIKKFKLGVETRKISKLSNRLLFPLLTPSGEFLAFQGRALNPSITPKYWHQKFDKKTYLYGIYENQELITDLDFVVLIEGNIDVVTLWQCGIPAGAKQGTALTPMQVSKIRRYTKNIVYWIDNDEAGIKRASADRELLNIFDCNVYEVMSKKYKDPNEMFLAAGAEKVVKMIYG